MGSQADRTRKAAVLHPRPLAGRLALWPIHRLPSWTGKRVCNSLELHRIDMSQAAILKLCLIAPRLMLLASTDAAGAPSLWTSWLEPTGSVLAALLLLLLCLLAWCGNLIALPGNWLAVVILAAYAWLGPEDSRASLGVVPVVLAGILALIGEILEFLASAMGAKRAGASRRSTLFAVIGSVGGAILGAVIGLPIPVIGPILAAILFAGLGATAGAMFGEWSDGKPWLFWFMRFGKIP